MSVDLAGDVAVVTGAASGIGRALAEELLASGMTVVLADIEAAALAATAGELAGAGGHLDTFTVDVSDADAVTALARHVLGSHGTPRVVCSNAGVGVTTSLVETPIEDWEWVMGVNLYGTVHLIRAFVPAMLERDDSAHLVITASTSGLICTPTSPPYTASKHALVALAEAAHHQLADTNVGVTCLCPGVTATNILDADRNRPGGPAAPPTDPQLVAFRSMIREHVASSTSPSEVARCALEAMSEGRFWAIPTEEADDGIRRRFESILGRTNPTAG
jgi:NAD(P)-dependent dehydrogenase (short-subunit alcohol dehydrogenase family)